MAGKKYNYYVGERIDAEEEHVLLRLKKRGDVILLQGRNTNRAYWSDILSFSEHSVVKFSDIPNDMGFQVTSTGIVIGFSESGEEDDPVFGDEDEEDED